MTAVLLVAALVAAVAASPFELANIDLVLRNGYVHKHWNQAILKNRIHRGRKTGRNRNHFVTWNQTTLPKFRRG